MQHRSVAYIACFRQRWLGITLDSRYTIRDLFNLVLNKVAVSKRDQIRALLKSIETGNPEPVSVVNEEKYIQHNPQTHEGSEGLAALFQRLSKTSPRVNIVRAFEDGDFVFAHTEYDFANRNIGFEVFRFEDGQAVEHWDNIQRRDGPNKTGRSMVDGPTEAVDHELTESNRALVRSFVETVLIDGQLNRLVDYLNEKTYAEHNPRLIDDVSALKEELEVSNKRRRHVDYQQVYCPLEKFCPTQTIA